MFKLVIQDDEGKTTVVPLIRDEITIGRKEGNTIRLTERNVSRRHARILRANGEVQIEDLGSYNGIRVNNARIAERVALRVSDQVQIGDYKLYLKAEGLEQVDDSRTMPLDRVDSQAHTEAMAVAMGQPTAMQVPTAQLQITGNPNRTMVAIADTDPTARTIGPETAAVVAAMTAPGGYGRLVVLSSNFAGKEFELSRPQMIIGRTDENDIVVNHRSISRNHAKLVREPETGRYTISDLQSSNGVRVNGQDYGKVELRRGDVVDLGHVRLRFVEAGEDFVFARDAVITDVPETGTKRGLLVVILAAIVVLVAGIVLYTMRSSDKTKQEDAASGSGSGVNGSLTGDAGDTAVATNPGSNGSDEAVAVVPAVARPDKGDKGDKPDKPDKPDDDRKQKVGRCTELQAQKDWQGLEDCSQGLKAAGLSEAKDFHVKASQEMANSLADIKARQLLREGNLREAQSTLKTIGPDSVYFASLRDAFTSKEAPQVEEAKRKAFNYAAVHDCLGLKRLQQQLINSSTERVIATATAIKCSEKSQSGEPAAAIKQPAAVGSGSTPPSPPPQAKNGCETTNVEDLMNQAANQFGAGYAKSALSLVMKALACKQDVRMYRVAGMYACAAHDLVNAKVYFNKVPPASGQSGIEQKCQLEGLNLRGAPSSP